MSEDAADRTHLGRTLKTRDQRVLVLRTYFASEESK
jgi:hypothetical protein